MATGFPCGQTPLEQRLEEIRSAVNDGAKEIDIVINRTYALTGDWQGKFLQLYTKHLSENLLSDIHTFII